MAQLISVNSVCLNRFENKIHDPRRTFAARKRQSSLRNQQKDTLRNEKHNSSPDCINLNMDIKHPKNGLAIEDSTSEWFERTQLFGSYISTQLNGTQSRMRTCSRQQTSCRMSLKPGITSPQIRLNVNTLYMPRLSSIGNQTCYFTRNPDQQDHATPMSKLMGVKSSVSSNGKVMILNLFDPTARYKKCIPNNNNWLLKEEDQLSKTEYTRRRKRNLGCYSAIMYRSNQKINLQDFEINPWGHEDESISK